MSTNGQAFGPDYHMFIIQSCSTAIRFLVPLLKVWIIGRQGPQIFSIRQIF